MGFAISRVTSSHRQVPNAKRLALRVAHDPVVPLASFWSLDRRMFEAMTGVPTVTGQDRVSVTLNLAWTGAAPVLSVLTPFLRDDPSGLLQAIEAQAARLSQSVEIIALDDGSNDEALADLVRGQIEGLAMPAAFVRLLDNEGRSAARNRLAQLARGRHLLYLDADTVPDAEDFLQRYLDMIAAGDPPLVIGGFSLKQASQAPQFALHRTIATRLDCMPVKVRQVTPWRFVYGSNILVRRDVMHATPFNPHYRAWGWEDQEWGMRVANQWPIVHVDNTVTHLGLDTVETLIEKYASSGANFHRLVHDHPERVRDYPAYRAARLLRFLPFKAQFRSLAEQVARSESFPLGLRTLGLRFYRVLNYLASH